MLLRWAGYACIDHLARNERAARAGEAEGIHQMRVAVRRWRATLSARAPFVPEGPRRSASNELRWVADAFGEKEERHRLRINVKKLRYTTELLGDLYEPESTKDFIRKLKQLQDDLGEINDMSVARDIIASLADPDAPNTGIDHAGRRIIAWHKRRLAGNEPIVRRTPARVVQDGALLDTSPDRRRLTSRSHGPSIQWLAACAERMCSGVSDCGPLQCSRRFPE